MYCTKTKNKSLKDCETLTTDLRHSQSSTNGKPGSLTDLRTFVVGPNRTVLINSTLVSRCFLCLVVSVNSFIISSFLGPSSDLRYCQYGLIKPIIYSRFR